MSDVPPSNSFDPSAAVPYKAQYKTSPEFRKFWAKLFPQTHLSDKQVSQMTDQFVRNVWNQMNQVLQWALKKQKERDQEEKSRG